MMNKAIDSKLLRILLCFALLLTVGFPIGQIPNIAYADCAGLQGLIDNTPSGGTLNLPACTYRESAFITKPITIIGSTGTRIKGSDLWTGWTQRGDGRWKSNLTVPNFDLANMECEDSAGDRCKWREQVFYDDQPLVQVAQGTNPGTGEFALDSTRRVILFDNPNNHKVEVTTREYWINGTANDVTIDNIIFRHAANDRGLGALDAGGNDWTIKNSNLGYAHAANVAISQVTGSYLLNNEVFGAGQAGIVGNSGSGTIEGGRVHDNNIEGTKASWAGGGIKISNPHTITITGVEVDHNNDNGIWTDVPTDPQNIVISGNRVHHNRGDGIRVEVTKNADVNGNVVYENGWARGKAGIAINASSDINVRNNVLAWNYQGIQVRNPLRTDVHPDEGAYNYVYNVHVHHNNILAEDKANIAGRYALSWIQAWTGGNIYDPAANNTGNDNQYWYTTAEGSIDRFRWSAQYTQLSQFNATPGEENGAYLTTTQKNNVISTYSLPALPESH